MKVGIKKLPNGADLPLPHYATPGSAGLDLLAATDVEIELKPGARMAIPTGIAIELPLGVEAQVRPLQARLRALLGSADHSAEEVERRFRLVTAARRRLATRHFESVATATLRRHRLRIAHYSRQADETTQRTVSPQQLVFYRDNWYLIGWCHLREDIRSFAIDAISAADPIEEPAREVDRAALAEVMESGYGIFSGREVTWATLRFAPERARWVAAEVWHPQQRGRFDDALRWILELPYNDPRELMMDVLKHGASVEVLAPAALREAVMAELAAALGGYAVRAGPVVEPVR